MSTAAAKRHMARVAQLPCAICGNYGVHVHHPRFCAGMAQRASDFLTIPLCPECHEGKGGIHGDRSRWAVCKMDEPKALAWTIEALESGI